MTNKELDEALEFVNLVLEKPSCIPDWERKHWETFRTALQAARSQDAQGPIKKQSGFEYVGTAKGALLEFEGAVYAALEDGVFRIEGDKMVKIEPEPPDTIAVKREGVPEGLARSILTCTQALEGYVPMPFARSSFGRVLKAASLLAREGEK